VRRLRGAMVIPVLALGLVTGCGGEEKIEFKPTDSGQFDQMKNDMLKSMAGKGPKGAAAPKAAPAPAPTPAPAK
jgi:hypothetical protein